MIVAEIIARLTEQATTSFAIVEGAGALAALGTAQPTAVPAAYVYIAEEAAAENERVNAVLQRMEMDVSVVVITSNVADPRGDAASDEIESLKRIVRQALVGWQPPSADDVITNVGSKIVRVRDGAVWCELSFGTATYEDSNHA